LGRTFRHSHEAERTAAIATSEKPHIALIGLSGSGKSSVARLAAEILGWNWIDTDAQIVAQVQMPIASYFAAEGEAVFRDLEAEILAAALALENPTVVATGGGIVLRPTNRALIRARAWTAWLDAEAPILLGRLLTHAEERPLLAGADPYSQIQQLRLAREPLYEETADTHIDTGTLSLPDVAARIVEQYRTIRT
jgi:shikimate kinase